MTADAERTFMLAIPITVTCTFKASDLWPGDGSEAEEQAPPPAWTAQDVADYLASDREAAIGFLLARNQLSLPASLEQVLIAADDGSKSVADLRRPQRSPDTAPAAE